MVNAGSTPLTTLKGASGRTHRIIDIRSVARRDGGQNISRGGIDAVERFARTGTHEGSINKELGPDLQRPGLRRPFLHTERRHETPI